ncbi:MAG: hypothetical protein AAGA71_21110 [Pseudomonadota bacterium]
MPTILGFAPNAFEVLSGSSALNSGTRFRLPPEWEASEDLYEFDITDADATFQGDTGDDANEVGDDSSQDGTVRDAQGTLVDSGQFYLEDVRTFTDPEGNTVNLYRVEIAGNHVGWIADGELKAGVVYEVSSDGNVSASNDPNYTDLVDANFDEDDANSILGSGFDETLIAGDEADSIDGGAGDDEIYAGTANDVVAGNTGNDFVYGGAGDDTADGGSGDDTIYGGTGSDSISGGGGTGRDVVYAGTDNDTVDGGQGADFIDGGDLPPQLGPA